MPRLNLYSGMRGFLVLTGTFVGILNWRRVPSVGPDERSGA